jgi:hypothetical protein
MVNAITRAAALIIPALGYCGCSSGQWFGGTEKPPHQTVATPAAAPPPALSNAESKKADKACVRARKILDSVPLGAADREKILKELAERGCPAT